MKTKDKVQPKQKRLTMRDLEAQICYLNDEIKTLGQRFLKFEGLTPRLTTQEEWDITRKNALVVAELLNKPSIESLTTKEDIPLVNNWLRAAPVALMIAGVCYLVSYWMFN